MLWNGSYYKYDPRLMLIENTLEAPASLPANMSAAERQTYAEMGCPSVVKTFVNKDTCVRTSSCAPLSFSSTNVELNETNVRLWYTLSARHVHCPRVEYLGVRQWRKGPSRLWYIP